VWYKRSSACKVDFLNIEYNMMDNSLGQQEGEVGVLVRAYRRASSQTSHERETVTEVPQGEMVVGLEGDWINVEELRVEGLQNIRLGKKRIFLEGDRQLVGRFKGWLTHKGEILARSDQPEKLKEGKKGLGGFVGQVNTSEKGRGYSYISRIGEGDHSGAVFIAPGGVLVEVHFGDVEQLELRYGKKERVSTPSADEVAREKTQELSREEEQRRGAKLGWQFLTRE